MEVINPRQQQLPNLGMPGMMPDNFVGYQEEELLDQYKEMLQ